MTRKRFSFGCIPDRKDDRDLKHVFSAAYRAALPKSVDLRAGLPPVFDQGTLGSCTANAIATAHMFSQKKQPGGTLLVPSRLFIYFEERVLLGTTGSDSGAQIRDGFKVINKKGTCREDGADPACWPYDVSKFKKKPPQPCYDAALKHQSIEYRSVSPDLSNIRAALASGYLVVFGFTVYSSFLTDAVARTGLMPVPKRGETKKGGHAIAGAGYDDAKGHLIIRNSWDDTWGDKGDFYMPYEIIDKGMARDFWTLKTVEE
jgi:C1A family cysteine protease